MPEDQPGLHDAIGGTPAWRKLSAAFYSRVERDPVLRPLFPGKTLHCAIEEFTAFLVQFFGGPAGDTQRRWWVSLRESHRRFRIGPKERTAWLKLMSKALDDAAIDEPHRSTVLQFFERSSAHVVNTPASPETVEMDAPDSEIGRRWHTQLEIDAVIAAIRERTPERAIALAQSPTLAARFARDCSTLAGLLMQMMTSRYPALLRYVEEKLAGCPALAHERYAGHTLLHHASGQSNPAMVELLLRLGADPNATDGGGHTPLYWLANGHPGAEGARVVHALVRAGAGVDARDGVKHCTPLHMAARRGNVEVAEALLDSGAAIDPRDSSGDTPLHRAVNCNQPKVARLLLARGADIHSIGSKGLTPLAAARTHALRTALQSGRSSPSGCALRNRPLHRAGSRSRTI